jgi:formylglycine-generating enzyme required for sulfatase activity
MAAVLIALAITACENGLSQPVEGKTDPTVTWPQGLAALPEHTLADIALDAHTNEGIPGTFAWDSPIDTSVGALGLQSHSVTFTPDDTEKYNTVTNDVDVLVALVDMVRIKAGSFWMGMLDASEANPYHYVTLTKDFYLGKYEITQELYLEVIGTNPSYNTTAKGRAPFEGEIDEKRPVETVRWYEALIFCNKLSMLEGLSPAYSIEGKTDPAEWGVTPTSATHASYATWHAVEVVAGSDGYRLPTEAQWEYAARAGTTTIWYGGESSANIGEYAWYRNQIDASTGGRHEVGKKKPNAWGLYDMIGNVAEFLWDRATSQYTDNVRIEYYRSDEAKIDPVGISTGTIRLNAGGSSGQLITYTNLVNRFGATPFSTSSENGIRVLRPVQGGTK